MALPYIAKDSTLARQSTFGVFHGAQPVRNLGECLRREVLDGKRVLYGIKASEQLGERQAGKPLAFPCRHPMILSLCANDEDPASTFFRP